MGENAEKAVCRSVFLTTVFVFFGDFAQLGSIWVDFLFILTFFFYILKLDLIIIKDMTNAMHSGLSDYYWHFNM